MTYYFVEYLRARRAILVALVLLGLFMLSAIALRAFAHEGNWSADLVHSPTAHVTTTTLPDGSTRTVVDDPQRQTHAVIVKHPGGAADVNVIEPKNGGHSYGDFTMGSTTVNRTVKGGMVHTTIHFTPGIPKYDLGVLFLVTLPMGLIVASLLGGTLAKENDGHLELAWTKPVSREGYALASAAVDIAAIVLAQLLTIAAALLASLMFFAPHFAYGSTMGWNILLALAGPIAWYALITAASASLRRGPGLVIGLGWVAALIVPGVAQGLQQAASVSAAAEWFYAIFKGLSYLDPIAYLGFNGGKEANFLLPLAGSAGVLCALAVGYIALAVAQWRRVEA